MKYCLNSRLSPIYLKEADQIKIAYRDIKTLPDIFKQYPDKEIICNIAEPPSEETLQMLRLYSNLKANIILEFPFFPQYKMREGFRFYTSYPVESLSEARALINQGVEYLKVGNPLFFMMNELKSLNIPVRFTPNRSWLSVVPRENGICGQWIRPEDVYLYDIIPEAVIEFDYCHVSEEEALFRIYKHDQNWPGPLNYLISDLNSNVPNRMILPKVAQTRLNCGQKCMGSSICRVCSHAFQLISLMQERDQIIDKT